MKSGKSECILRFLCFIACLLKLRWLGIKIGCSTSIATASVSGSKVAFCGPRNVYEGRLKATGSQVNGMTQIKTIELRST
jgi:hypothetical protein